LDTAKLLENNFKVLGYVISGYFGIRQIFGILNTLILEPETDRKINFYQHE
jgi:hypothetical protein